MTTNETTPMQALDKLIDPYILLGDDEVRDLGEIVRAALTAAPVAEERDTALYDIGSLTTEHRAIYGQIAPHAILAAKTWARGDDQYNAAKIGAHRAIVHLIKRDLIALSPPAEKPTQEETK